MSDPRTARVRRIAFWGLGGLAVLMALVGLLLRIGGTWLTPHGRILVGTAAFAALILWWGAVWLRMSYAQDEYMRWMEHRTWYWGSLLGMIASVPVFAFVGLGGLHWLLPATDSGPVAARAFASGYMLLLEMQVAGVFLVAIWRKLAKK